MAVIPSRMKTFRVKKKVMPKLYCGSEINMLPSLIKVDNLGSQMFQKPNLGSASYANCLSIDRNQSLTNVLSNARR